MLSGTDDLQGLELSPVLFLSAPETLEASSLLARAELYATFDRHLEDDELVVTHRRQIASSTGAVTFIHMSPSDLDLTHEQGWYCRLRCEGTPPDVAANIVRLALRS